MKKLTNACNGKLIKHQGDVPFGTTDFPISIRERISTPFNDDEGSPSDDERARLSPF
jgi:hypothetical protein